jgi:HAD superfamily hydrolase (TIGR01549 family)
VPEVSHRDYWLDLVAADWPPAARALVAAEATPLCRALVEASSSKRLGPGIVELLDWCRTVGIRIGIVSNTLLGDVNRTLARQWGTLGHFAVQVHSDEVGIRKPDPEMILIATRALGIDPGQAWFVGDNYDKDVLCARRAGVGASVLMRLSTDRDPGACPQPDLNVADGFELRDALAATGAEQKEGAA